MMKWYGVSSENICSMGCSSLLTGRRQRVLTEGVVSGWEDGTEWVLPKGSGAGTGAVCGLY